MERRTLRLSFFFVITFFMTAGLDCGS
jgi:hypothetical protein